MSNDKAPRRRIIANDETALPEVQAGSRGLSLAAIAKRYLEAPGHALAIVRLSQSRAVETIAAEANIDAETLLSFERGGAQPTPHQLVALATALRVSPRRLSELYGHVDDPLAQTSHGFAAMFGRDDQTVAKLDPVSVARAIARKK